MNLKKYPKTVACLIWTDTNQVFLAKRINTDTFPDYWEGVGGKMETGEDPVTSISREVQEEMGIWIPDYWFRIKDCIINDPTTDKCFLFEVVLTRSMWVRIANQEVDKRTEWEKFTIDQALSLTLMPGLREYFLDLKANS